MNIRDTIVNELKQTQCSDKEKELLERLNEANREISKYKVKEVLNRKQFNYILCTTKKGNKFIKIIYDSYEADGWVEIARIYLSKSEWVRDRFSIEDVLAELKS